MVHITTFFGQKIGFFQMLDSSVDLAICLPNWNWNVYQFKVDSICFETNGIQHFESNKSTKLRSIKLELSWWRCQHCQEKQAKITPNLIENTSCLGLIVGLILVTCSYLWYHVPMFWCHFKKQIDTSPTDLSVWIELQRTVDWWVGMFHFTWLPLNRYVRFKK